MIARVAILQASHRVKAHVMVRLMHFVMLLYLPF
jgi:hypothetical protein